MASSRQVLIGFVLVFCWMACVLGRAQGAAVQEQSVGSRRELLASCGAESGCSTCSTPVSYLDSCNTPSFSGCQICAACAAPNGDKTYSCVDTSNGCNSIDNILGYLKCQ